MLVIAASVLVDALLVAGPARARLASDNLQEGHALQALATADRLGMRRP
jgi:hypothetical protein